MALKRYRRQVINVHDANDNLPEVILSTGDEAGRIIQLAIISGESSGTHCRFWLQKDDDTNVFQDMESVTAPYPTWEAAINTGGLNPGTYPCMFRIGDNDGSVTETFRTTARVVQGMLIDAEESEEMQSQLSEFEQRTEDAIDANQAATAGATDAAERANAAAISANDAATAATEAATNVEAATTAANGAAESATDATTAANAAADDATDAATEARDAAAAALASVGNIVVGEINMLDGSIETIDDAFVSPLRGIEVEGKSTQVSIGGNQLLNVPQSGSVTSYGVTFTFSADGSITMNGTSTSTRGIDVATFANPQSVAAGSYYLSGCPSGYSTGSAGLRVRYEDAGGTSNVSGVDSGSGRSVDFESAVKITGVIIGIVTGVTYTNVVFRPMLNAGSMALPWEPYVGGIPSPNPDYPQAIHSAAEAGQVITGRCVWGGEKMADDIVAAVGDATNAYKGEDANGKFVALVGSFAIKNKRLFDRFKNGTRYTFLLTASKNNTSVASNMQFVLSSGNIVSVYTNGSAVVAGEVTKYANSSGNNVSSGESVMYIESKWHSGTTKIYYEQSGLFEGALTTADFAPYLGTTTPLIPSGVEPLRSLQDGTRDELVVHEDGSREIIRRVGKYAFGSSDLWSLRHTTEESGIRTFSISLANKLDYLYTRTSASGSLCNAFTNLGIIIGISGMYNKGVGFALLISAGGEKMMYANVLGIETEAAFNQMTQDVGLAVYAPLAVEVIEPLPSLTMPSAPSSDMTAWLDSKDESSAPIATDSSIAYERSMQIVIDKLEQAIADI